MAQHDYTIANQGFPATRSDINNVLSAISTNNSGTSAPTTQYAGQFWIDTTASTWTMYIHDGADDIQFATIDTSANTVNFIDSELGADSVNGDKIADDSIDSEHYVDGSIDTAHLSDGAVTSAKLSSGKVLQVVSATTETEVTVTGTTFTDTTLTASITPISTSSKILILTSQSYYARKPSSAYALCGARLLRGTTTIWNPNPEDSSGSYGHGYLSNGVSGTKNVYGTIDFNYLDSPSTTSATTYKTQIRAYTSAGIVSAQENGANESSKSSIILMEISG